MVRAYVHAFGVDMHPPICAIITLEWFVEIVFFFVFVVVAIFVAHTPATPFDITRRQRYDIFD